MSAAAAVRRLSQYSLRNSNHSSCFNLLHSSAVAAYSSISTLSNIMRCPTLGTSSVPSFKHHPRAFTSKSLSPPSSPPPPQNSSSQQHEAWVQFQKSISVSGFETGQTTTVKTFSGRKGKGGRLVDRKKKEREAELEASAKGIDITQLKGGEFPPLRYSEEETKRLLAQAYAAIPPRAGKRGTLNLKRQERRWHVKRQYDAKKKRERMDEHTRRMEKRHAISEMTYKTKIGAEEVRKKDKEYQKEILERWFQMSSQENGSSNRTTVLKAHFQ